MDRSQNQNERIAMKVSINTIIGNVILAAFKLFAGIVAGSGAMLSDAVHTLSDVLSTIIVIIGVRMAGKASDERHQYGHERMECVAAILLAVMLCATGVGIGYSGVRAILAADYGALAIPGALALIAAVASIAIKEAMYWYTRSAAKRIGSGALMADAWHHRSDALSSVGSFIGILGARLGWPVLDPVASVVICLFIAKASYDIFMDAIRKMTDEACDEATVDLIKALIGEQEGVMGIDRLNTRRFGTRIFVDVEIGADGKSTLSESHGIAERVHDALERAFPNIKHCMVHVNPQGSGGREPAEG